MAQFDHVNLGAKVGAPFAMLAFLSCATATKPQTEFAPAPVNDADAIQIYDKNPRYWQYRGKPVLLAGGSIDDNLFQYPDIVPILDEVAAAGGNYLRNTMSDRKGDDGFEIYAFGRLASGKYDLNQWNDEYWVRFERFLYEAAKRDIVVQLEIWDRFDWSRENWPSHPFNPGNNINFTEEETGLAAEYPKHPGKDVQPVFHSIPGLPMYSTKLDVVRKYQEAFVGKLLSISLRYGNVLYCMNNETSTPPAWGQHWISFIKEHAKDANRTVYVTDMFDAGHDPESEEDIEMAIARKDIYDFMDISQVNSRNFDDQHWSVLMWYFKHTAHDPRPLNHTKIYGGRYTDWGSGGLADGVQRFWRNVIAGSASVRFHRPPSGNGLNTHAKGSLGALRQVHEDVPLWNVVPAMERLRNVVANQAYAAAGKDQFIVFFPRGTSAEIDLTSESGAFRVRKYHIDSGKRTDEFTVNAGAHVELVAHTMAPTVFTLVRFQK